MPAANAEPGERDNIVGALNSSVDHGPVQIQSLAKIAGLPGACRKER